VSTNVCVFLRRFWSVLLQSLFLFRSVRKPVFGPSCYKAFLFAHLLQPWGLTASCCSNISDAMMPQQPLHQCGNGAACVLRREQLSSRHLSTTVKDYFRC